MSNFRLLLHPIQINFGVGSSCSSSCDGGKTKSTPSPGIRLEFDKRKTFYNVFKWSCEGVIMLSKYIALAEGGSTSRRAVF